jgi:phosphate-selective porin OprO and OprP
MLLLVIPCEHSFSQETIRVIPNGTEGEVMVVKDSETKGAKIKNWNEFDGPLTTLKINVWYLEDFVAYKQDAASKEQFDLNTTLIMRDLRFALNGRFKIKRDVTWKAGLMYDTKSYKWAFRETGILVAVPELSGYIFAGRTKEAFSLEKIMVGYAIWGMERPMITDLVPILADGVKWLGYLPKQRLLWNIGFFDDFLSKNQSFSTYNWQSSARIGWLPVYSVGGKKVLSLAVEGRYGKTKNDEIQVRSRPEAYGAPYFVDTEIFPAHHSIGYGGEAYYRSGSLMFGGEYYAFKFSSIETNNPVFHGGGFMATYLITGELRPYNTATSIFGFVPVKKSVFDGGPGAWEAGLQLSNIDLDSGTITGGKFWKITPMLNWYLSENVRFELAYGYGVLDRFEKTGVTQFFQSRIQFRL